MCASFSICQDSTLGFRLLQYVSIEQRHVCDEILRLLFADVQFHTSFFELVGE